MRELMFSAIESVQEANTFDSLTRFEKIAEVPSLIELGNEIRKVSQYLGFSHYLYGARVPLPNGESLQYIFSGYPEEWMATYQSEEYIKIDPIVEHCFFKSANIPLVWSDQVFDSPERKLFHEDAQGHGVATGLSVPVRGSKGEVALFSGANPERGKEAMMHQVHIAGTMYVLGAYVHEAIRRLVFEPEQLSVQAPHLTAREMECLRWWVSGKSAWEISHILSLSERTVRFHLDNIKKKFGAQYKAQVVAKAIRLKVVR